MDSKVVVDHYTVLGLPSGEEGSKLSLQAISTAYKYKALQLHPDKCRDDDDAPANFQRLHSSYAVLKDEKARKAFDDQLRCAKLHRHRTETLFGSKKRRNLVSELRKRERSDFESDPEREYNERTKMKLQKEIDEIRAKHSNTKNVAAIPPITTTRVEISIPVAARHHEAFETMVLEKMRKKACL